MGMIMGGSGALVSPRPETVLGTQAIDEHGQPIPFWLIVRGLDDVQDRHRPAQPPCRRGGDAVQLRQNSQALGLPAACCSLASSS